LAADALPSLLMKLSGCPSPVRWRITSWKRLSSPFIDYVVEVTITPGTQAVGRRIRYYGDGARDQRGQARQDVTMQVHEHAPFDCTRGLSHRVTRCDRFDAQCRTAEDEAKRSSPAGFDADPCRPSAGPADRGLRVRPARARSPSLLPAQRRGWSRGCRTSATRATRLGRARPYSTAEQRPHSEAHEAPRCRLTRLDIEGEGSCSF
jgi:hypothetical protein